jgi:hypothetical protein
MCLKTVVMVGLLFAELPVGKGSYQLTRTLDSPDAMQAAVADDQFVYAISNRRVARHDRTTGELLAVSTGDAEHLNYGILHDGRMYLAHSNYPKRPEQSDLRVLEPKDMILTTHHVFESPPGSLTWALPKNGEWWCHFAHYGADNGRSVLVQYRTDWTEIRRFTYPSALVADWGRNSLSGGLWDGDILLATGHDDQQIYRLRLPATGTVMDLVDTVPAPFTGQGFARDPATPGGLVGIHRPKRQILFARFRE